MPPARSKARKRALDILFEAELRDAPVLDLLAERITQGSPPVSPYAADLVRGVTVHKVRIDKLIEEFAEGWTLDRMPAVDRNVLRIGIYELLWADDVPDGVAISEAEPGVTAVAAAIQSGPAGPVVATVSVAGPGLRMPDQRVRDLAPIVIAAAAELSALWPLRLQGARRLGHTNAARHRAA